MAPRASRPGAPQRRAVFLRVGALAAAAWVATCALCSRPSSANPDAFVGTVADRSLRGRAIVRAEAKAPSPSPSYALVKVTEENKVTTASMLGGLAGLLVGGVWVGGALFAATAYLSRKDESDVSKVLKGVASGSLEVLNFGSYLNEKFTVSDKIGSALSEAAAGAKGTPSNKEALATVESFLQNVGGAITALDQDIGIKDTLGTLAASASELASQAVEGALDLNAKYKVTDKIKEAVAEALDKAKTS